MLSSDKNVETVAQLVDLLRHYLAHQAKYAKLTLIDKVVRLVTVVTLAIIFVIIIVAVLLFFWLSMGFWLSHFMGLGTAFLLISALHLLLLLIIYAFRTSWIERPLVRFLADLLMK